MWNNSNLIIQHIENALQKTESGTTKLIQRVFDIEGMTGRKTRIFYNNLCEINEPTNYLEIGAWKGSSTASSLYENPNLQSYICDNWSEFMGSYDDFCATAGFAIDWTKTTILQGDFRMLDFSSLHPIHIYIYDGPHGYKDFKQSITLIKNSLATFSIFIVSNWNWDVVREGTQFGFDKSPELKILYKKEIDSPIFTQKPGDEEGYWNGLAIFVLEKTV